MTCIIGIEADGKAYIGADSSACSDSDVRATAMPKVFRNNGVVIGYSTSFRMGQLLQYMDIPQYDIPDEKYMITKFIEAVREEFKIKGYSTINNNEETGGSFIVGIGGYVYGIHSDYQVQRYIDGIIAVGCGMDYAYGALRALDNLPAKDRILKSLEIAAYYSRGVCAPFTVLETKPL